MAAADAGRRKAAMTDTTISDLEQRTVKALTGELAVEESDDGLFTVTGESGNEYTVDADSGACTCPDAEYNLSDEERCKHARRVAFRVGDRAIPEWANEDAIHDPLLAAIATDDEGNDRDAPPSAGGQTDDDEVVGGDLPGEPTFCRAMGDKTPVTDGGLPVGYTRLSDRL